MVVFSPERNKPFRCKTILLFCPPGWELTEMGLLRALCLGQRQIPVTDVLMIWVLYMYCM